MDRAHDSARLILLCSLLLTIPGAAANEPTPKKTLSVEEQFSLYHAALSSAANNVLSSVKYQQPQHLEREAAAEPAKRAPESEGSQVRQFARYYWGGRSDDLQRALSRLRQLRPTLEPILRSEGLPTDLIGVVLVESAAQSLAHSSRGARGLWQFIPATARRYGLSVSPERDDRVHTEKATRAAARYLRDLYHQFGDWLLALAAYNAGEQTVERALGRAGSADFWSLSRKKLLPAETRNYVRAVLAAVELLGDASAITPQVESGKRGAESRIRYAQTTAGN